MTLVGIGLAIISLIIIGNVVDFCVVLDRDTTKTWSQYLFGIIIATVAALVGVSCGLGAVWCFTR